MPSVLAIAAHPDDIEFVMAGTMLLLGQRGWDLHYFDIANGCCGSMVTTREETARIRLLEAQRAAALLNATFYPPLCPDMEVYYEPAILRRVAAVIRQARPQIVLTHAPADYMQDHENACRLAVSAAFTIGVPNFETDPLHPIYPGPVTVYHAQPHGNRTPLGEFVTPHFAVNIESVLDRKVAALECHASQRGWLDASQGMGSYVQTMHEFCQEVGLRTNKYTTAEGWRRRQHWGYCGPNDDPLRHALADLIHDFRPT